MQREGAFSESFQAHGSTLQNLLSSCYEYSDAVQNIQSRTKIRPSPQPLLPHPLPTGSSSANICCLPSGHADGNYCRSSFLSSPCSSGATRKKALSCGKPSSCGKPPHAPARDAGDAGAGP